MEKTTIQINQETLERLKMFRQYERESYDEVLNSLIDEAEEETLNEEEIEEIKESLDEVKNGKIHSIQDVAKDLGITLR